jgi:hypothetical protein
MSPQADERLGPEFSRLIPIEAVGSDEITKRIEASEAERQALARRLDLLSLDRLVADLRISRPEAGPVVALAGRFEAEVTQACVITLAPVHSRVVQDFAAHYAPAADAAGEADLVEVDPAADDPPEPLGPHGLDLGEAVVQQLAVALDPYPRAEGATLESLDWRGTAQEEAARSSPFKDLEGLVRER